MIYARMDLTAENVLLTLKEFVVVWVNQILYYNGIYVATAFDKVKSFDVIVYQSRSPVLNDYLNQLVNDFIKLLLSERASGKVSKLMIVVYETRSRVARCSHVIQFSDSINLASVLDTSFLDKEPLHQTPISPEVVSWDEIYTQIRSLLFHHVNELRNRPNESLSANDLFYKAFIEINDGINIDKQLPQWVKAQPSLDTALANFDSIGSASLGLFNFDLHFESSN